MEYSETESLAEALMLVRQTIRPERLNTIQESIFSQCWAGESYPDIAALLGYNVTYIRAVGAQLWQLLSKAFGEKVTKSNFQAIIRQHLAEKTLSEPVHAPSGPQLSNAGGLLRQQASPLQVSQACIAGMADATREHTDYYIERPPIERRCYEAIGRQGALLRIKAPKQMGKTLLMTKILLCAKQHEYHTLVVNLRLADRSILSDLDRFLKWFCAVICDQLHITADLEQYWKPVFGSSYNCTQFFNHILLPQLPNPIVLALDEVDVLFEYSETATAFLGLIRVWCERSKQSDRQSDAWHLLRLLVIHSTEVYIPLPHHQSPFNVGLSIELPDFTPEQVLELAQRYGVSWTEDHVKRLMALVGGKPNLIRLTLDWAVETAQSLADIIENATTPTGIYHEHLRQKFQVLQKYPDLTPLLQQVMVSEQPVALGALQGFQLEGLGLIKLQGQRAIPSCMLYRQYFGPLLNTD